MLPDVGDESFQTLLGEQGLPLAFLQQEDYFAIVNDIDHERSTAARRMERLASPNGSTYRGLRLGLALTRAYASCGWPAALTHFESAHLASDSVTRA